MPDPTKQPVLTRATDLARRLLASIFEGAVPPEPREGEIQMIAEALSSPPASKAKDSSVLVEALRSWIGGYASFTDEAIREHLSLSSREKERILASRKALAIYLRGELGEKA